MKFFIFHKYFLVILGLAVFAVWQLSGKAAVSALPPKGKELIVNVMPLKAQDVQLTNQYVGYVIPIKSVEIVPNVSGYIDEVFAEGGQEVKTGDNLVLIDQREYKAQLDAAQSAEAQAKANYTNARSYYNRLQKAGKKAVSASALDEAKAKFLAAEAALKQAKADVQKASVLYDDTVLQAPIDGITGNVALTKGNYVSPASQPLFSIIQFDPIRIMFALPDREYLNELQHQTGNLPFAGEEIKIRLANGSIYPFAGTFKFADNQIDKATNSVSIFADFSNPDKQLMANSYVDVLLSRSLKNVFLIGKNYVTLNNEGAFVYIMNNGKMQQIPLKIAGYLNNDYVVENQFGSNDFLVTDKIGRIAPNTVLNMKINTPEAD